jgi:hypothetical protein
MKDADMQFSPQDASPDLETQGVIDSQEQSSRPHNSENHKIMNRTQQNQKRFTCPTEFTDDNRKILWNVDSRQILKKDVRYRLEVQFLGFFFHTIGMKEVYENLAGLRVEEYRNRKKQLNSRKPQQKYVRKYGILFTYSSIMKKALLDEIETNSDIKVALTYAAEDDKALYELIKNKYKMYVPAILPPIKSIKTVI